MIYTWYVTTAVYVVLLCLCVAVLFLPASACFCVVCHVSPSPSGWHDTLSFVLCFFCYYYYACHFLLLIFVSLCSVSFDFSIFLSFIECVCRACSGTMTWHRAMSTSIPGVPLPVPVRWHGIAHCLRVPCLCVLHIEPSFLPVDIQHNQCPCRCFNPREIQALWSQNYASAEIPRWAVPGMQYCCL